MAGVCNRVGTTGVVTILKTGDLVKLDPYSGGIGILIVARQLTKTGNILWEVLYPNGTLMGRAELFLKKLC